MTKIIRTPMHRYFLVLMTWHLTRAFYGLLSCSNYLYQKHDYTAPDQNDFKTYLCVIRSVNCYIYIIIQFQDNSVSYRPLKTLYRTKNSISKKPVMQKSCILVFTCICRHSKHEKPFYYKYGAYYWGSWVFNIL